LRHRWLRSGKVRFPTLSRPHPGELPGGSVRFTRKRPATRNRELGGECCLRPSVPCRDKKDLERRTSGVSICGFKRRCPGEPCDYRRSLRTATVQKPECQKRQATSQDERAIDPLRHSTGVVLEKQSGSVSPGAAVAQGHARQETAQRTSAATPADITGSHVTIAERSLLGSACTSSIMVRPGGTFVCARRKAK